MELYTLNGALAGLVSITAGAANLSIVGAIAAGAVGGVILDDIREKTQQKNLSFTLSIGVGADSPSLIELGQLAQSSLDLVLGRGGDQVAIKQPNGKIRFYGGKTNPVEKPTRVGSPDLGSISITFETWIAAS